MPNDKRLIEEYRNVLRHHRTMVNSLKPVCLLYGKKASKKKSFKPGVFGGQLFNLAVEDVLY